MQNNRIALIAGAGVAASAVVSPVAIAQAEAGVVGLNMGGQSPLPGVQAQREGQTTPRSVDAFK